MSEKDNNPCIEGSNQENHFKEIDVVNELQALANTQLPDSSQDSDVESDSNKNDAEVVKKSPSPAKRCQYPVDQITFDDFNPAFSKFQEPLTLGSDLNFDDFLCEPLVIDECMSPSSSSAVRDIAGKCDGMDKNSEVEVDNGSFDENVHDNMEVNQDNAVQESVSELPVTQSESDSMMECEDAISDKIVNTPDEMPDEGVCADSSSLSEDKLSNKNCFAQQGIVTSSTGGDQEELASDNGEKVKDGSPLNDCSDGKQESLAEKTESTHSSISSKKDPSKKFSFFSSSSSKASVPALSTVVPPSTNVRFSDNTDSSEESVVSNLNLNSLVNTLSSDLDQEKKRVKTLVSKSVGSRMLSDVKLRCKCYVRLVDCGNLLLFTLPNMATTNHSFSVSASAYANEPNLKNDTTKKSKSSRKKRVLSDDDDEVDVKRDKNSSSSSRKKKSKNSEKKHQHVVDSSDDDRDDSMDLKKKKKKAPVKIEKRLIDSDEDSLSSDDLSDDSLAKKSKTKPKFSKNNITSIVDDNNVSRLDNDSDNMLSLDSFLKSNSKRFSKKCRVLDLVNDDGGYKLSHKSKTTHSHSHKKHHIDDSDDDDVDTNVKLKDKSSVSKKSKSTSLTGKSKSTDEKKDESTVSETSKDLFASKRVKEDVSSKIGKSVMEDVSKEDKWRKDKSKEDKSREDKSREDKSREDKSREDKSREDKLREDKSREDKSREDKLKEDKKDDKMVDKSKDLSIAENSIDMLETEKSKDVKLDKPKVVSSEFEKSENLAVPTKKSKDLSLVTDHSKVTNKSKDSSKQQSNNISKSGDGKSHHKKSDFDKHREKSEDRKHEKSHKDKTQVEKPHSDIKKSQDEKSHSKLHPNRKFHTEKFHDVKKSIEPDKSESVPIAIHESESQTKPENLPAGAEIETLESDKKDEILKADVLTGMQNDVEKLDNEKKASDVEDSDRPSGAEGLHVVDSSEIDIKTSATCDTPQTAVEPEATKISSDVSVDSKVEGEVREIDQLTSESIANKVGEVEEPTKINSTENPTKVSDESKKHITDPAVSFKINYNQQYLFEKFDMKPFVRLVRLPQALIDKFTVYYPASRTK